MSNILDRSNGGARPQRRELTGRTVLFCLVAFFAVVATVNAVMMAFAVTTFGGVETKSSYQAGVLFAREEAAAEAQQSRHWRVSASLQRVDGGSTQIELTAQDAENRPLAGLEANIALIHPTDRRLDRPVTMYADGGGRFLGAAAPAAGQWDLVIELSRDGERLFRSRGRVILR